MVALLSIFWIIQIYFVISIGGNFEFTEEFGNIIIHDERITFEKFVEDIKITAFESPPTPKTFKIYKRVSGPDGIDIDDVVIEFDPSTSTLGIAQYKDGKMYLNIKINCIEESAFIRWILAVPGLGASPLMIFTNALLLNLYIKQATMYDGTNAYYEGCDGNTEHLSSIVLYALHGKTQGWSEHFGYKKSNDEEISTLMKNLHDQIVPILNQKLGDILNHYWQTDKCEFSKIYQGMDKIFEKLEKQSNGYKMKQFTENRNAPHINIFEGSFW